MKNAAPFPYIWRYAMHNLKTIEGKVRAILEKDESKLGKPRCRYWDMTSAKGIAPVPFRQALQTAR